MKKLILISILFIIGCIPIKYTTNDENKKEPDRIYDSTAFFIIGMTEEEFIRKNPSITENNDDDEFPIYIESCKEKYKYIAGKPFPHAHCEEYTFEFGLGILKAVYRGRNNFNREIDYSRYPNSKPVIFSKTTEYTMKMNEDEFKEMNNELEIFEQNQDGIVYTRKECSECNPKYYTFIYGKLESVTSFPISPDPMNFGYPSSAADVPKDSTKSE